MYEFYTLFYLDLAHNNWQIRLFINIKLVLLIIKIITQTTDNWCKCA